MASPKSDSERPPLGGWGRVYLLVAILAVLVMLILWWFTATRNIRLEVR